MTLDNLKILNQRAEELLSAIETLTVMLSDLNSSTRRLKEEIEEKILLLDDTLN